ncbi:MAG: hypothetical protein Rubg2KO_37300 [Rubricoccaceae bacterium]
MPLRFWYEPNGTQHNDVFLRLAETTRTVDSYYFALDTHFGDREDDAKVRAVVAFLLNDWETALSRLIESQAVYLPFDFSDQYIGGLECRRSGDSFVIRTGWTQEYEGHSLYPSDSGRFIHNPGAFMPAEVGPVRLSAEAVFEGIRWSIEHASQG